MKFIHQIARSSVGRCGRLSGVWFLELWKLKEKCSHARDKVITTILYPSLGITRNDWIKSRSFPQASMWWSAFHGGLKAYCTCSTTSATTDIHLLLASFMSCLKSLRGDRLGQCQLPIALVHSAAWIPLIKLPLAGIISMVMYGWWLAGLMSADRPWIYTEGSTAWQESWWAGSMSGMSPAMMPAWPDKEWDKGCFGLFNRPPVIHHTRVCAFLN